MHLRSIFAKPNELNEPWWSFHPCWGYLIGLLGISHFNPPHFCIQSSNCADLHCLAARVLLRFAIASVPFSGSAGHAQLTWLETSRGIQNCFAFVLQVVFLRFKSKRRIKIAQYTFQGFGNVNHGPVLEL